MVLMNDQLYNIVQFICSKAGHPEWIAPKDDFTFKKISLQILSIGTLAVVFLLLLFKRLDILVKISSLGIVSIGCYFCFMVWAFGDSVSKGVPWKDLPLFRSDLGNLLGSSILSYTIHTVVISITKTSLYPTRN